MLQRSVLAVLLAITLLAAASPKPLAPDKLEHGNALFLRSLSADGKQRVQFKATALDTHFFLEEPAGVTVYEFDGAGYSKVDFMKGATLGKALKKYRKK